MTEAVREEVERPPKTARLHRVFAPVRRFFTGMIDIAGPALGTVFFIPRPEIGVLIWLALVQNPRDAGFALLGLAVGDGIARVLGISDKRLLGGGLKTNAVLTAIAVAWLTAPVGLLLEIQIAVAAAAAAAAAILTAALMRELRDSDLPVLVWGYCLIAGMLFAVFPYWTHLAAVSGPLWLAPIDVLDWIAVYFKSLGALMFLPTVEAGLVIAIAILLWSRAVFATGTAGWIAGVIAAQAFQNVGMLYYWQPTSYNFFIAGIGLGAVFFLPGQARMLMGAAGGFGASFFAVVLQYLFHGAAFAYLPVPAALTIWLGIGALGLAGKRMVVWRNLSPWLPPEEGWLRASYWSRKLGHQEPLLVVPVSGPLLVSQGFRGRLSHTGLWRHALDLQRPPPPKDGLDSYGSIWGAPVTAPASGFVERVKNDIADNPLGVCNYADNWGNYVVIRLDQGGWVLVAHMRQGTVAVRSGERIEVGTRLGEVGNSGRSPIPHLHLQVQSGPEPGTPTVPFRLANFLSASSPKAPLLHWHTTGVPADGTIIMAAKPNPPVHSLLASISPGQAVWAAEAEGRVPRAFRESASSTTMRIRTVLDANGRHLFESESGGILVSGLDPDAWRVIDLRHASSAFLRLLALAAPSVPFAATAGMRWREAALIVPLAAPHWLQTYILPYLSESFTYVQCTCLSEPGGGDVLSVRTNLETRGGMGHTSLPFKLICDFDRLRGPVKLEAAFEGGSLTFSQVSFRPGLPLNADSDEQDIESGYEPA